MEDIIQNYPNKYTTVLLFGPPGVGKDTLGRFLGSGKEQVHLASGKMFKTLNPHTKGGELFHKYAAKGELVPDKEAIALWKNYVHGMIATNLYSPQHQDLILHGMPRTLPQAELLDEYITVKHIIVLENTNRDQLFHRLQLRHLREGIFRDMDPKAIHRQIDIYHEKIGAVLEFYPSHIISRINAQQKPLEIVRDVLVKISHILSHHPNHEG